MNTIASLDLLSLLPPPGELLLKAVENQLAFAAAQPFPHVILDGFLPNEVAEQCLEAFPDSKQTKWFRYNDENQVKLEAKFERNIPYPLRNVLCALNSATVLLFLEQLTGIRGLVSDPSYNGAGLHQILPGGKLAIHTDFTHHPRTGLWRRLNLLLYLNKDWKAEYGGALELWDGQNKQCLRTILPVFNRCVIFPTTATSYHGHPKPLRCPEDRTRKSIALYYYAMSPPPGATQSRTSTVWLDEATTSKPA